MVPELKQVTYIGVKAAAELLNSSPSVTHRWLKAGRIKGAYKETAVQHQGHGRPKWLIPSPPELLHIPIGDGEAVSSYTLESYISLKEAAEVLSKSVRQVNTLLLAGRIVGAVKARLDNEQGGGTRWFIPTPPQIRPAPSEPIEDGYDVDRLLALGRFTDESNCDESPKCLECPLDVCKFEPGASQALRDKRYRKIVRAYQEHPGDDRPKALAATAAMFGVGQRTVVRALTEHNSGRLSDRRSPVPVIPGPEKYFKAPRVLPAIRRREVAL
jgi:hypothetical protein